MAHIHYGYKIIDGKAVVDKEQAENIRNFYKGYISGLALKVAEEMRIARAGSLGRIRELEKQEKPKPMLRFTIPRVQLKYTDPFEQAKYAYGLIESEVTEDE